MSQRARLLHRGIAVAGLGGGLSGQGLLPACSASRSLLQHIQLQQNEQEARGNPQWKQPWDYAGSTIGWRYASTSSAAKGAGGDSGNAEQSAYADGADLTPAPEYFPLPEYNSAEVVAAITQATDALERASILGAKADAFFSASWCISGLQAVHEALGLPW